MKISELALQLKLDAQQIIQIVKDSGIPVTGPDDEVDNQTLVKLLESVDKLTAPIKEQLAAQLSAQPEPSAQPQLQAVEKKKVNPSLVDLAENIGVEIDSLVEEARKLGVSIDDPAKELSEESGNLLLDNLNVLETSIKKAQQERLARQQQENGKTAAAPHDAAGEPVASPSADSASVAASAPQSAGEPGRAPAGRSASLADFLLNPYVIASWILLFCVTIFSAAIITATSLKDRRTREQAALARQQSDRHQVSVIWKMEADGFYKSAYQLCQSFKYNYGQSELLEDVYYKAGEIQFKWKRYPPSRQFQAAIIDFDVALKKFPRSSKAPWALMMIAESYRNLNLYENAVTYYKKLIVSYPGFEQLDRAHFMLADSYFRLSRFGQALREYSRLIARFPRSQFKADSYLQIAVCFESLNRYEYALQAYAKFLKLFPADPHSDEVRFSVGTVYYKNRQYQKAIDAFKETVGVYPYDKFNARAYFMIAESLSQLGDFEQARKWMFDLVYSYMQHPLAKDALFKVGDYFLAQNNAEQAREFYEKALEKDPANPLARDRTIALAEIYFAQKDYGQAIMLYERALTRFPNAAGNDRVLMQTGRAYALKGNHIQAAHAFDRLVRDYPSSALIEEALYSKADGLFSLDMFKEAQQTYVKLFSLFPRTGRRDLLFYRLALCSFNTGDYEAALNYARDGFRKAAYTVYAYRAEFLQARALIKLGALNDALSLLERMARGGQVKDKEVYYQICFTCARLAAELKLPDKAIRVLNRLMRSWHGNYHFTEALALKVELLKSEKKVRRAVEAYRGAIESIRMQVVLSERDRIKQQVELADSLTGLGDLLFEQKDYRMALVQYTRAWQITGAQERKSWLLFQIANCHVNLRQPQQAQQFFVRLKNDYPASFWAGKADWYMKNADWNQVMQP